MQSTRIPIQKVAAATISAAQDDLAIEEPLELHLLHGSAGRKNTQVVSVTMRTPGADAALGAGFLFTEGILRRGDEIAAISEAAFGLNTILITLKDDVVPRLQKAERNFYTTSSCGVCGKAGIDAIKTVSPYPQQPDNMMVDAALLYALPAALCSRQDTFNSTGGLHASALFDLEGNFIALQEDVGRHNALDKLIGAAFLKDALPLHRHLLLLSGRASFELVQKAAMAGIKMIAAVGAPSSLAVELAAESGITLLGFLRGERFNIYTGAQRIKA